MDDTGITGVGIDVPTVGDWLMTSPKQISAGDLEMKYPLFSWVMFFFRTFTNPWQNGLNVEAFQLHKSTILAALELADASTSQR